MDETDLVKKLNILSNLLQKEKYIKRELNNMILYRKNCIKNNDYGVDYMVRKKREILLLEHVLYLLEND